MQFACSDLPVFILVSSPFHPLHQPVTEETVARFIKDKYGYYSSWAIWSEEDEKPKSNIGDLDIDHDPSWYDYNRNDPDRENPFTDPKDRERAFKVTGNSEPDPFTDAFDYSMAGAGGNILFVDTKLSNTPPLRFRAQNPGFPTLSEGYC